MINQWILKIQQMPSLLLGFIVLVAVLIGMTFYSPPTTICDVQMTEITKRLSKGFFVDDSDGAYGKSAKAALDFCYNSNSPGGCHDLFTRLNFFEKIIRTLPTECGTHTSAVGMQSVMVNAFKLFGRIGWGAKPPVNKYNKTAWLDTSDLGLYCRLKRQYKRLYGKQAWETFTWSLVPTLPDAQTLSKKQMWDLSLFSYNCRGLY